MTYNKTKLSIIVFSSVQGLRKMSFSWKILIEIEIDYLDGFLSSS